MVGNKREEHYTGSQATLYFLFFFFLPIFRETLNMCFLNHCGEKKECEAFVVKNVQMLMQDA